MSDDWPQIKARLEQHVETVRYIPGATFGDALLAADIRAALKRVEACETAFKRQGEILANEIENHRITAASADKLEAALRQRVEELERDRAAVDEAYVDAMKRASAAEAKLEQVVEANRISKPNVPFDVYKSKIYLKRAEAAEAKLARVVEAGELLLEAYGEAHALYDLGDCEGSVKMRAALAAAKGE